MILWQIDDHFGTEQWNSNARHLTTWRHFSCPLYYTKVTSIEGCIAGTVFSIWLSSGLNIIDVNEHIKFILIKL